MDKPTIKALRDATGISQSYASMILSDDPDPTRSRTPSRSLAIFIFRKLAWRHPTIAGLTDDQMAVFEQVDPWSPRPQVQRDAA